MQPLHFLTQAGERSVDGFCYFDRRQNTPAAVTDVVAQQTKLAGRERGNGDDGHDVLPGTNVPFESKSGVLEPNGFIRED
jgi:hypothetical protein